MDSVGTSVTGLEYRNQYHDLLQIRDGKIVAGREYLDTTHAQAVIVGSAKAAAASSR
jgi:ketosteroid isomerase-like protein